MIKFFCISIIILLFFTTSCNKPREDVLPGSDIPTMDSVPPGVHVLLSAVYLDGHPKTIFLYNGNNQVKNMYEYVYSAPSSNSKMDYEYSSDGKVYKETGHYNYQPNLKETLIEYSADTIFYAYDGNVEKRPVIQSNISMYRGSRDTMHYLSGFNTILEYSVYQLAGDDLSTFIYEYYFSNPNGRTQNHYEETYTYDTTINPLWSILENGDPFFAWKFADIRNLAVGPFAYAMSKHNPIKVVNSNVGTYTRLPLPQGVTFKYKLLPGSSYPKECIWINNKDGSVYATYKYVYIKAS